uniref:ATR interacting protein n=1 Tax=Buteo japonicus TaxID=224669 RepID=A0A8C0C3V8_9AVES
LSPRWEGPTLFTFLSSPLPLFSESFPVLLYPSLLGKLLPVNCIQREEMQDEILTKNGEIKILRDSMQQMEYAMEEQKRSYMLLEQQKTQTLSEKEKEFSKKLLSLQSELQFKDAEMNELRTRLQNCERNKHVTQMVLIPKKNLAIQVKSEGCSPQPGKRSFPTKESFNAEMSARPSCSSGNLISTPGSLQGTILFTIQNRIASRNFNVWTGAWRASHQDSSILLNALMKQPIVPGSLLGLCHLLSSNSEPPPGAVLQPNYLDRKSTQLPSSRTTQEETAPLVSLREAQELAITGLNLIAMDEGLSEGSPTESRTEFSHLTRCKIRGAVHLLPLVEHHIGAYCQAVQLAVKSVNGSCGNHSITFEKQLRDLSTASAANECDNRLQSVTRFGYDIYMKQMLLSHSIAVT